MKNFNINIKEPNRNLSSREAFEMAEQGAAPGYKRIWVEKVGWTRKYAENWEKIFGKN